MTRSLLEVGDRASRSEGSGWILHPDRRRFSVRSENGALHASRAGVDVAFVVCGPDLKADRAELVRQVQALPSIYAPELPPAILSRIDRIRELTAWVAELDRCEARAVELRGLIEGAAL